METRILSTLEQKVMSLIWDCTPCSIKEIKSRLDKKKKLAYTTVATLVQRLENKGMLKRVADASSGSCFRYAPKMSREAYSSLVAQSFISNFQHSFGDLAIASFANSINSLKKAKREYFLKLLSKHAKK
ncbi:MAG: BlaI/MecI/CopY family transcriptional regulator [Candidatus Shapirobacteria bacterium]